MSVCEICGTDVAEEGPCLRCSPTVARPGIEEEREEQLVGNRYRIDHVLGRGGFGVVYHATDTRLSRPVAVKRLLLGKGDGAETGLARFRHESLILASLDHPHIVPVFDTDVDEEGPFIVMKFVEGEPLSMAIRRRLYDERGSLSKIGDLASALEHAHARGVLHRDLKPSNVIRGLDDWVYLVDFGVSAAGFLPRLTAEGGIVGSLHYLAPEAVSGEASPISDVYSLGALFHEVLFGSTLFEASSAQDLIHKICHETPRTFAEPPTPVSPDTMELLKALLEKDPSKRVQSASEVCNHVSRLLAQSATASVELLVDSQSATLVSSSLVGVDITDRIDRLEQVVEEVRRFRDQANPGTDEALEQASIFVSEARPFLAQLEERSRIPAEEAAVSALALSVRHMSTDVERTLREVFDDNGAAAFLLHLRQALTDPLSHLIDDLDERVRLNEETDFFSFDGEADADPAGDPLERLADLSSDDELARHEALLAMVGRDQAELVMAISRAPEEVRARTFTSLWENLHVVLQLGRSRARTIFDTALSADPDANRVSNWRLIYSLFKQRETALWDPDALRIAVAGMSEQDRRVFGRCLLIHPVGGYRELALAATEPSDWWYLIASPATPLAWLLNLLRSSRRRVSSDFLKVFFVCVRDRLSARLKASDVVVAADLLKELFEIDVLHEDVFFRMLSELDRKVRESCRQHGLLVDFDAEYLERAKSFFSRGVRKEMDMEEWSQVPLPIQRHLARAGHFTRHFACHPIDAIAMECLPHLMKMETGRPIAEMNAVNSRLLAELGKVRRLFLNDDARAALVRNPKTPAYIVMKYIGFVRRDALKKIAESREGNSFAREYAKKALKRTV